MDAQEFDRQVSGLRERLYRFSLRMLDNTEDAEDVVQEAFLRLWLMRAQFASYRSVPALAMKVAKNLCYDYLKRRKIRAAQKVFPLQSLYEPTEKSFEQRQMIESMKQIVASLPGLQQMIFKMKDIEGYTIEEIATITGTRADAVRMNLCRARSKIREKLNQYHP